MFSQRGLMIGLLVAILIAGILANVQSRKNSELVARNTFAICQHLSDARASAFKRNNIILVGQLNRTMVLLHCSRLGFQERFNP